MWAWQKRLWRLLHEQRGNGSISLLSAAQSRVQHETQATLSWQPKPLSESHSTVSRQGLYVPHQHQMLCFVNEDYEKIPQISRALKYAWNDVLTSKLLFQISDGKGDLYELPSYNIQKHGEFYSICLSHNALLKLQWVYKKKKDN